MMQHMQITPIFTKLRFAMWDDVLAEPAPAEDLRYSRAIWHAARAIAHAAQGRFAEAEKDRAALAVIKDDEALKTQYVSSVNTASAIAAIAYAVASGELSPTPRRARPPRARAGSLPHHARRQPARRTQRRAPWQGAARGGARRHR
jgi:hypothetical protein